MTVTLTLNEITAEQAELVLDLIGNGAPVKTDIPDRTTAPEPLNYKSEFEEAESEKAYAVEDVRNALAQLAKTKGNDAAKAVLGKFGASKVTELKPEQFAALMKEVG